MVVMFHARYPPFNVRQNGQICNDGVSTCIRYSSRVGIRVRHCKSVYRNKIIMECFSQAFRKEFVLEKESLHPGLVLCAKFCFIPMSQNSSWAELSPWRANRIRSWLNEHRPTVHLETTDLLRRVFICTISHNRPNTRVSLQSYWWGGGGKYTHKLAGMGSVDVFNSTIVWPLSEIRFSRHVGSRRPRCDLKAN